MKRIVSRDGYAKTRYCTFSHQMDSNDHHLKRTVRHCLIAYWLHIDIHLYFCFFLSTSFFFHYIFFTCFFLYTSLFFHYIFFICFFLYTSFFFHYIFFPCFFLSTSFFCQYIFFICFFLYTSLFFHYIFFPCFFLYTSFFFHYIFFPCFFLSTSFFCHYIFFICFFLSTSSFFHYIFFTCFFLSTSSFYYFLFIRIFLSWFLLLLLPLPPFPTSSYPPIYSSKVSFSNTSSSPASPFLFSHPLLFQKTWFRLMKKFECAIVTAMHSQRHYWY